METWQVQTTLRPPGDLVCHRVSITCHSPLIGPDSPDQKMSSGPSSLGSQWHVVCGKKEKKKKAKPSVNKMT